MLKDPNVVALFDKYKVLTPRELESRYEIYLEQYVKTVSVEIKLTSKISTTTILPAALKYQRELAETVAAVKAAGQPADTKLLERITKLIGELQSGVAALESVAHHEADGVFNEAKHLHNAVLPAMLKVREAADALEGLVDDALWPLPTYQEMLFIR
jgi:glutamine synthetase